MRQRGKNADMDYIGRKTIENKHGRWSRIRGQIIAEIRVLHRRNEPLNITAVKRLHPKLMEAVYKIKPYWGWRSALEASDVDYSDIRIELLDYVTCEVCNKDFARLTSHLHKAHQISPEDYRIDYPDAETVCELLMAENIKQQRLRGVRPRVFPDWEPVWSREYALDRVREFFVRGFPVNLHAIKLTEKRLYRAVRKYFPSWDEMLESLCLFWAQFMILLSYV